MFAFTYYTTWCIVETMKLVPINSCVVVQLTDNSQFIDVPDKQFATQASGVVIEVPKNEDYDYLLGKVVYFEEYRDSAKVEIDDEKFAFIKYEDIKGYQDEQNV